MAVVTMKQLLEAGVQFGHQTRRWNPKMRRFIHGDRAGIHIVDLRQTLAHLEQAYVFVRDLVAGGSSVLFIGTKKQAQDSVQSFAERCNMPYVNQRWQGGMLTNFNTIAKRIAKMKEYQRMRESGEFEAMPKKEALLLQRELFKLERNLGGIRDMTELPGAVFILDTKKEHIAVTEARKLALPIVAVVDTNCDPDLVDYAIPGNDDAIRSGQLMARVISDAVQEGRFIYSKRHAEGPVRDAILEAEAAQEQQRARAEAAAAAVEREARVAAAKAAAQAVAAHPTAEPGESTEEHSETESIEEHSETPEASEGSGTSGTAETSETRGTAETSETPESSETSGTSDASEISEPSEGSAATETPERSGFGSESEAQQLQRSDMREKLRGTGMVEVDSMSDEEIDCHVEFSQLTSEQQHELLRRARFDMGSISHTEERSDFYLPTREPSDPDRRARRVKKEAREAPVRENEKRERSVDSKYEECRKDARTDLREWYTNGDGIMICQLCQDMLPFRLRDGTWYFEAIQFLEVLMEHRSYRPNFLALCPNHAAMFQNAEIASADQLMDRFLDMDDCTLEIALAGQPLELYFVKTHILDLRAAIEVHEERQEKTMSESVCDGI